MAWQLIYTSAPRLLEAGRSGFGSVARHRQISPLLVSAIERASQFSRQPGMDSGRVIFSHRIIPISGGRFHVLSCIRDAGADYTGRTNHIAHHVIAEARELAQLPSEGASPADVLLTMPWLERWEQPPHYFEAADEVHLSDFAPQTHADGAHWARVTGNAAHAWLLAAGEASRGAYIIQPPGVDLRWLFADSLRLAPERLWQTSFTTSLQSKDEISDYRWIGLDSDSPLRHEAGASGRAILDLTQPHLLPAPEAPAAASNPPATYTSGAKKPLAVSRELTPVSSGATTHAAQSISAAPGAVSLRQPSAKPESQPVFLLPTKTRHRPIWIIWMAAAILLVLALIFGVYLPWKHLADLRGQIVNILKWSEYFPDKSLDSIAADLLPNSASWPLAEESAKTLNRIATALMQGELESIRPDDEKQLHTVIGNGGAPPPDITRLQGLLDTAKEKSRWRPALRFAKEAVQLQQAASDDINSAIPNPPYEKLNKALRARSDLRIAVAEYDLLARNSSIQPPESAATFQKSLSELKAGMAPGNPQALGFIEKAEAIVSLWEVTETASGLSGSKKIAAIKKRDGENAGKWPGWLLKKVSTQIKTYEEKFADTNPARNRTPPRAPSVPLYVVGDIASLKEAHFNELRGNLTYFLRSPSEGAARQLRDPGNEGKLRLKISENPVFLVNEAAAQVTPERAGEALQTPLFLIAKDGSDHEVIEIWVAAGADTPFLPSRKTSMTRAGNALAVNLDDLSLPGVFKTPLRLCLPDEYNVSEKSKGSLPLKNGKADIANLLEEITARREAKAKEIENLKNALALRSEDSKATFADRKYLVIEAAKMDDELRRKDSQASKDLGKDSAPLFQQCGNLIVAITRPAQFTGADKLFEIGAQLSKLSPGKDESVRDELLSAASAGVARAIASLSEEIRKQKNGAPARSQEEMRLMEQELGRLKKSKEMDEPALIKLKELIDSLLPETAQAKAARETAEAQLHERLTSAQKELAEISAHPLLTLPPDGAPIGTYRLLAQTARGGEALLLKLEVAP